jgi:hypothetical protein
MMHQNDMLALGTNSAIIGISGYFPCDHHLEGVFVKGKIQIVLNMFYL